MWGRDPARETQAAFKRIGDAFNKIVGSHNDLVKKVDSLSRSHHARGRSSELDALREIISTQHAEAARYSSLIIVAGYAAFFTMWGSTRSYLGRTSALWCGLLIAVSVLLFISFEVAKMILGVVYQRRLFKAAGTAGHEGSVSAIKALLDEFDQKLYKAWWWVLVPTLATGFGGAGVLIYAYVRALVASDG